jgi:hypothetical protein
MEKDKEKRAHERLPYESAVHFTVLMMQGSEFRRVHATGAITDVSKAGIEILTEFPLQPGQVLQWDDRHKQKQLHIALVKWSQKQDDLFKAGLMFI